MKIKMASEENHNPVLNSTANQFRVMPGCSNPSHSLKKVLAKDQSTQTPCLLTQINSIHSNCSIDEKTHFLELSFSDFSVLKSFAKWRLPFPETKDGNVCKEFNPVFPTSLTEDEIIYNETLHLNNATMNHQLQGHDMFKINHSLIEKAENEFAAPLTEDEEMLYDQPLLVENVNTNEQPQEHQRNSVENCTDFVDATEKINILISNVKTDLLNDFMIRELISEKETSQFEDSGLNLCIGDGDISSSSIQGCSSNVLNSQELSSISQELPITKKSSAITRSYYGHSSKVPIIQETCPIMEEPSSIPQEYPITEESLPVPQETRPTLAVNKESFPILAIKIEAEQTEQGSHECNFCPQTFENDSDLLNHLTTHVIDSQNFSLENPEDLEDHKYHCKHCKLSFNRSLALKKHLCVNETIEADRSESFSKKGFACGLCSARFPFRFHLNRHLLKHGEKPLDCSRSSDAKTDKHLLICTDEDNDKIEPQSEARTGNQECPKTIELSSDHSVTDQSTDEEENSDSDSKLKTSSILVVNIKLLKEKEAKKNESLRCKFCLLTFKTGSALCAHLKSHVFRVPDWEELQGICNKNYSCQGCNRSFRFFTSFKKHVCDGPENEERSKKKVERFKCNCCFAHFPHKSLLKEHSKQHKKSFKCPRCCQICRDGCELRQHLLIHTETRAHRCPECGDSFKRKYHLNRHLQTHTGKKPHPCPICGKRFTRYLHVVRHLRTH